jgi:hypothetical protein
MTFIATSSPRGSGRVPTHLATFATDEMLDEAELAPTRSDARQ